MGPRVKRKALLPITPRYLSNNSKFKLVSAARIGRRHRTRSALATLNIAVPVDVPASIGGLGRTVEASDIMKAKGVDELTVIACLNRPKIMSHILITGRFTELTIIGGLHRSIVGAIIPETEIVNAGAGATGFLVRVVASHFTHAGIAAQSG